MHEDIGRLLIRREEMVQEARVLRCACGHGILCEVKRGEYLGFLASFDVEPTSQTHGERL
jgi:hypothetical protein